MSNTMKNKRDQLDLQVLSVTRQYVHCSILYKATNTQLMVTSVYASNSSTERSALWNDLKIISAAIGSSGWIVRGDFNEVRFSNEKVGGHPVHHRRPRKFNSSLLYVGLDDLKSIGHTLSWSNSQTDLISCRLDRVLGNQMFISSFPHSFVEYLQPGISDHSPMKVTFDPPFPTGPKPFKYFEAWEEHPSFSATVQSAWNLNVSGNPLYCFIAKLSNLKRILKIWNRDIYGPIQNSLASSK
ncbi:hypothetical protein QJS10_CPA07g00480 [Acorus calamus]|uniref:Uncharacterized protein n=1 Tax=Acorus calamus TaxID=4465 RepID=A0AAV9EF59_ACOCL|nr:hypothetical protein QJS10_CPA07g00480 [Acorus calamus]